MCSHLELKPRVLLAWASVFAIVMGCNKPSPPASETKNNTAAVVNTPSQAPESSTTPTTQPSASGPVILSPTDPIQAVAEAIIRDLPNGSLGIERISPRFLSFIGRPLAFDEDRAKGYSKDAATDWLRRAGANLSGGVPTGYRIGEVAFFSASLQPRDNGRYLLRLVQDQNAWKLDWFGHAAAGGAELHAPTNTDTLAREFAVAAFVDAIADMKAMKALDRVPLLAGSITSKLRDAWASPFQQDKARGYEYNPAAIERKLAELGAGIQAYSIADAAAEPVRLEITRGGAKTEAMIKLVKGTEAGIWLVDDFH